LVPKNQTAGREFKVVHPGPVPHELSYLITGKTRVQYYDPA